MVSQGRLAVQVRGSRAVGAALFLVQETSLQMEIPFINVHFLNTGEIYVFYF